MSAMGETGQVDDLDGVPSPDQNQQLIGHQSILATLTKQLNASKLPSAVLLHGPKGIGKATTAFTLARQIMLATSDEPEARIAEQITQGSHPNLFVLRRKVRDTGKGFYQNIRVEEVRHVQQRLRQTRGRAGHRICIIDAIDDANESAANALLKILEEPPADTLFIAISHRPGALLPTIHSRCQSHAMRGLADSDVKSVVQTVLPGIEVEDVLDAIELSSGRPRRAIEALMLESLQVLDALRSWLNEPLAQPNGTHLKIAEDISRATDAETAFAREVLTDWLAQEVRQSAQSVQRKRLASATQLWDNAQTAIADADTYNLDARQMLVSLFDDVLKHCRQHALSAAG